MLNNLAFDQNEKILFDHLEENLFPNKKKKIMIVDDDQDFRLSLCELFVEEGFSVMTAKDGEVGLNNLIHQRDLPDLIILDIIMPIKNGLEFRREQLQLESINHIPVLFLTGQGLVENETCLLKPFDEGTLLEKVKSILNELIF
jgi:CheY-like chemotaxis protein